MRGGFLSIIGLGFFLLAFWRAMRVRRDLAAGQTRWESALFGRRDLIVHRDAPRRFWCAIAVHTVVVILFTLVAVVAFRATWMIKL